MKIFEGDRIRNPEEVAMDMFMLSKQPDYKSESRKEFLIKTVFIIFFLFVIRIGSSQQIPSIEEIIGIAVVGIGLAYAIFRSADEINRYIRRTGLKAIAYCCGGFIALMIIVGAVL